MRRLLTIGHSYVVAQNRRLAHEMAVAGRGHWQVAVAAPLRLRGDLRQIDLEPIENEACDLHPLPMRAGWSAHLRVYGTGLRGLLNDGWDVVHCWEEPYVAAAAQVARHIPERARFVPATFQNIAKRYPPPVSWSEQHVLRRADGWIAFGHTVHDTQKDRPGYRSRPGRVITPGVDVGVFRPDPDARQRVRQTLGWTAGELVAGFSGRFVPEKGIATLLDALRHSSVGWNLLFVGGGPMQARIEQVRTQHPSRVRVVTDVPHDEVPAYLNAMDLLCAPSLDTSRWREQFGRMLIEAMACGVPVIGSRTGEIPYVVGDAGVLVTGSGADAWREQIDRLAPDEGRRRDLAAAGLARTRSMFAWPAIARQHLAFFEELCGG